MSDWNQWYYKAKNAGYKSYNDKHKGIIVLDDEGNQVYQVRKTSPNYQKVTPQQVLGEYFRDWGPHITAEPHDISTGFNYTGPAIGELSSFDDEHAGTMFANRASGFFVKPPTGNTEVFHGKGPQIEQIQGGTSDPYALSPGYYTDADVVDDFSNMDPWASPTGERIKRPSRLGDSFRPLSVIKKVARFQQSAKRHGEKAPLGSGRVLGPEQLQGPRYNPQKYQYGQTVVVLDLETVGTDTQKGSILSYAAIKKAHNLDTGEWDVVSKRTRYYYSTEEDKLLTDTSGTPVYDKSVEISGLTDENITRRREMLLAESLSTLGHSIRPAKHFNEKELKGLLRFIGKDPVIGQNISQFDWPKLFGLHIPPGMQIPEQYLPPGGLIDVLHLAEGTRGHAAGLNTNEMLFTLAYGKTPAEAGFTTHDALEDVQITAKIFEAMTKSDSRMGAIARYLSHHPGLSTQWRDAMINGITEIRGMTDEQKDILKSIMTNPDEDNVADYLDESLARVSFDGAQTMRSAELNSLGASETIAVITQLNDTIKDLKSAIMSEQAAHTGLANLSAIKEAGKFETVAERTEYLRNSGFRDASPTVMEEALKKAGMYYNRSKTGNAFIPPGTNNWDVQLADLGGYGGPGSPFKSYLDTADDKGWYIPTVDDLKSFSNALQKASEVVQTYTSMMERVNNAHVSQAQGIYGTASYFIPQPFKMAGDRFFRANLHSWQSIFNQSQQARGLAGDILGIAGKSLAGGIAGGAMAGPWGAVGGIATGLLTGSLNAYGNYKSRGITSAGQDITSRIEIWSFVSEMLLSPLRILGNAFKMLSRITNLFGGSLLKTIASFNSLGIPLTNLTGLTYAGMQRSYVRDAMIGARQGTYNQSLNSFANAQMDLYTMGQLDQNRLIASAMLGTFGSVYAYGGDTQGQYADTINAIYRRMENASPTEKQRIMTLAGKIDSSIPTALQQMDNLGKLDSRYKDYRYASSAQWQKDRGLTLYTATDIQRARYTQAGMEFSALTTSMTESKNKIALRLWDVFGKQFMSGANDVLNLIAGGRWKDAFERVKTTIKGAWSSLTSELFGKEITPSSIWEGVKTGLKNFVAEALPILGKLVAEYVRLVGEGWAKIADVVQPIINDLVTRLSFTKIVPKIDWEKKELGFELKQLNPNVSYTETMKRLTPGNKEAFGAPEWFNKALYPHDPNMWGQLYSATHAFTDINKDPTWFLKHGPIDFRIGDEVRTISTHEEFQKAINALDQLRGWNIEPKELTNTRALDAYQTMTGEAIKNGVMKDINLPEIIRQLTESGATHLENTSATYGKRIQVELVNRDENGNVVGRGVVDGTGKTVERFTGTLKQLGDVTSKHVYRIGERIGG